MTEIRKEIHEYGYIEGIELILGMKIDLGSSDLSSKGLIDIETTMKQ